MSRTLGRQRAGLDSQFGAVVVLMLGVFDDVLIDEFGQVGNLAVDQIEALAIKLHHGLRCKRKIQRRRHRGAANIDVRRLMT